jgi:hypothetical protein
MRMVSPYRISRQPVHRQPFPVPDLGLAFVLSLLGVASVLRILWTLAHNEPFGAEATINLLICGLLLGRAKAFALSLARRTQHGDQSQGG